MATAPILHVDFTFGRVNGKQGAVIVSVIPNGPVLYQARAKKGDEGVKGSPLEFYTGTTVSDHEAAIIKHGTRHQECLAHIKRYLQGIQDDVNIADHIAQNFLTITANYEPLNNEQIKLKYSPEVAEKLIRQANELEVLEEAYGSDQFSINIRQNLYITKARDEADFAVSIEKESENKVKIIKELKDPSNTHKYSFQSVLTVVGEKMKKENIRIDYEKGFNSYVLNLFIEFYDVKNEPMYAYKHTIGRQEQYTYSQQLIEFIVEELKKNPDTFVESLRKSKR